MGQLEYRRPESLVGQHPRVHDVPALAGNGDGVAFDRHVDVAAMFNAEQGIAHDPADQTDRGVPRAFDQARQGRMRLYDRADPVRIQVVSYDPLSDKLRATTQVAMPELLERFKVFEHLSLTELSEAFDACEQRFRAWVLANPDRPISEAPDYVDRIALDSLRERRMWWA